MNMHKNLINIYGIEQYNKIKQQAKSFGFRVETLIEMYGIENLTVIPDSHLIYVEEENPEFKWKVTNLKTGEVENIKKLTDYARKHNLRINGLTAAHYTKKPYKKTYFVEKFKHTVNCPKDNTPGCTTEACDFRDALPGMGAKVIGISPDDVKSHQKFEGDFGLPFPLASDPEHKIAEAYGAWGEKQNYGKIYHGIIRSTFIIDPKGKIAEAMYNVKADGHVERVQQRLEALQQSGNTGDHA